MVVRYKALIKDAFRDIGGSIGRFLSILAIVALGVAFFTGLKIAPQAMKFTADKYYDDYKLMDIRLVSTLGLTDDDLEAVGKIEGIEESLGTYSLDALTRYEDEELVVRVHSYISEDQINGMRLLKGRFPTKADECLVEVGMDKQVSIPLGTKLKLSSGTEEDLGEQLENTEYTVVGAVQVPYYLSFEKGNASIGNGRVSTFVILPQENFKSEVYTDIYLTVEGARQLNSYKDEYFDLIDPVVERLKALAHDREDLRYQEVVGEAYEELEKAKEEYFDGKAEAEEELSKAQEEIEDAQRRIADGERELKKEEENFQRTIRDAREKIGQAERDLLKAEEEMERAKEEFYSQKAQVEEELRLAQEDIKKGEEAIQLMEGQRAQLIAALENPLLPEEESFKLRAELESLEVLLAETKDQVEAGRAQLEAGKQALLEGEEELRKNEELLAQSREKLEREKESLIQGEKEGRRELAKARQELEDGKRELEEAIEEYNKAKLEVEEELKEAWEEILKAQEEIGDIPEGKWYVLDRNSHYSYVDYGGAADRIDALSKVFPLFFALVAALVSLTTMNRMVDEQRVNIGTLKALGYDRGHIAFKYILYAFVATIFGCIIGIAIGFTVFPIVIFNAYGIMYRLPPIELVFDLKLALLVSIVALLLTTMTAYISCLNELKENAAALMRPKAPRIGKAIFLESIPFIWNRLNFSHKITARNLLRYKRRFFMTVFGIAGCTALLLTGFGIRDSIRAVVDRQYGELFIYDVSVGIEEGGWERLEAYPEFEDYMLIHREGGKLSNGSSDKNISILVPEDGDKLRDFIILRDDKSKEVIPLPDEGIIISKQVSKSLDIKPGDKISLINSEDKEALVEVKGITENYTSNFVYLSADYYEEVFQKEVKYNEAIGHLISMTRTVEDNLSKELLEEEGITSVSFNSILKEDFDDIIASLGYVVLVIIISAGSLAFVVLYNLTNVNISERIREIATIKVLGFYDNEVSMYVYRENIILTIFGTLLGLVLGIFLHRYIMTTVEMDNIMFGLDIEPMSFIYSVILTILFSALVNGFMYYKLRNIPMVESLKSVD